MNPNYLKLPANALVYLLLTRVVAIVAIFIGSFFVKVEGAQVNPLFISGGVFILGIGVIIYTVLYYNLFSYLVANNTITVNSGVIFRESKSLDFGRIQNINNVRGPVLMLLGLTSVQIWTASPGQMSVQTVSIGANQRAAVQKPRPEMTLILTSTDAEQLKTSILNPTA